MLAVSTWAVKARSTLCLLETVSQSVPGKGMGRETRPLVGYPIPIPPGPGRHSEAARGEDANQRQKKPLHTHTSQEPLHTHIHRHRRWSWRNGCLFLNLLSEIQPFNPSAGPMPLFPTGSHKPLPSVDLTADRPSLGQFTLNRAYVKGAKLQLERFQTAGPCNTHTLTPTPVLFPCPLLKPTRNDPNAGLPVT